MSQTSKQTASTENSSGDVSSLTVGKDIIIDKTSNVNRFDENNNHSDQPCSARRMIFTPTISIVASRLLPALFYRAREFMYLKILARALWTPKTINVVYCIGLKCVCNCNRPVTG